MSGHIPNHQAIGPDFCLYGNFQYIKINTTSINYRGHLGKRDRGSEVSRLLRALVEKSLCFEKMFLKQYIFQLQFKDPLQEWFCLGALILRMDEKLTPCSATWMTTTRPSPPHDFQHEALP